MLDRIRNRYVRFGVAVLIAGLYATLFGCYNTNIGGGGSPAPPPGPTTTYTDHGGVSPFIATWSNGTYLGEIDSTSYVTDNSGNNYQYTIDSTRVLLQEICNGSFETDADQTILVPLNVGSVTATHVNRATGGYANAPLHLSCPIQHAIAWTFSSDIETLYPATFKHLDGNYRCHDFGGTSPDDLCYPFDY